MTSFSCDADILKYEPVLLGELHPVGQILARGSDGQLSGTSFTSESTDFSACSVKAGGVIYLSSSDGEVDGAFEIVSVDSETEITISVVRDSYESSAIAVGTGSGLSYRICTYRPQIAEVDFQLTQYFGIRPGNPASSIDAEDILDTEVLRRASVFGVISSVYAMLASDSASENFWSKSLHYQKLFDKARQRCRLSIDAGGDGAADITYSGGSVRLTRG